MPEQLISNPAGAYGYSSTPGMPGRSIYQFVASGTITAQTIVTFDTTGNGTIITCTASLPPLGVALNSAVAGGTVDVLVRGFTTITTGTGGTTVNTLVGCLAAGAAGPASASVGMNVGVALATVAASSSAQVYVQVT